MRIRIGQQSTDHGDRIGSGFKHFSRICERNSANRDERNVPNGFANRSQARRDRASGQVSLLVEV